MKEEAIKPHDSNSEFPELSWIKSINDYGKPVPLIKIKKRMENSKYWAMHERNIGFLLLVSTFLLIGILINFSDVPQFIWDGIIVNILRLVGLA
jgi:hypothetical protein